MSRRSRRKSIRRGGWWKWMLGGSVVLLLLAFICVYLGATAYLHSNGFRHFLTKKVNQAAGVHGEFQPFHWSGLAVDSEHYSATGDGWLRGLELRGLHSEIGLGGLTRGVWQVENSRVKRMDLAIDVTRESKKNPERSEPLPPPKAGKKAPGWLPREVVFEGLDIENFSAAAETTRGPFSVMGTSMRVRRDGGKRSYKIDAEGGTLQLPFKRLDEIRLESARLRYRDDHVFLSKCEASAWSEARFQATGEWNLKTKRHSLAGELTGVKCDEALPPDWARKVTGNFATTFQITGLPGSQQAFGHGELRNASITALPLLDSLAAYLDTARFRSLSVSAASADWRKSGDRLELSNLAFTSEGLVRIEGRLSLTKDALDGTFQLGVSPALLAKLPGAETRVFVAGAHGMWWTQVRLGGTLDNPQEDLTDRLIAAAGLRMFDVLPETGEKVFKFSRSVLNEKHARKVENVLDKGAEIIRENEGLIREAKGVLEGILDR